MNILLKLFIFIFFSFYTNVQLANEVVLYADSMSYDSEKNLIAKGNAKIISENSVIISDLIIYNEKEKKYILPLEFSFKDEKNNYYYGTSGEFTSDFKTARIQEVHITIGHSLMEYIEDGLLEDKYISLS